MNTVLFIWAIIIWAGIIYSLDKRDDDFDDWKW